MSTGVQKTTSTARSVGENKNQNDTNEELYEEHTDYDHKNHKVNSHERVIILNRLKVGIRRVDCAPHDIDPALSWLDCNQR